MSAFSRVMSFGAPTPIEVAVAGQNIADVRRYAEKLRDTLGQIPTLRDLAFARSAGSSAICGGVR
jgi:hypothetical protein